MRGEETLSKIIRGAAAGRTREEIEDNVKAHIKKCMAKPNSTTYFDAGTGRWVSPESEYTGDTGADLKTVKKVIASLSTDNPDFDGVDQLLDKYFHIVRHGKTTHLQKKVEWILNDSITGRITISYKEGSTWEDDCWSDEIPLWLLLSILRAIERRKPLGDTKADETLKVVRDAEADYVQAKRMQSVRGIRLNTKPTFFEGGG